MKILVTGAGGYLGQGVVKQLLDEGCEVIAASLDVNNIDKRAKIKQCDIFSVSNPYLFFECPDVVLHMAWQNGFVHNDDSHIIDLPKHYSFIKSLINGGIKQVAVMGTMHEIGFYEGCVNENTPTHPENLYGISKDALRNIVKLLCQKNGITFQWLRGFYIVGNTGHDGSVFGKIVSAEKAGQTLFPFTTGKNQYDFLDYHDFCRQTAAAVEQTHINGIINICSGQPKKLSEKAEEFIQQNGFQIKLDYGKFPDRPYDSKAVWGNNEKIRKITGKTNDAYPKK